ncbi:hypothetical protein PoB_000382300 [Plakobranchus ocellatus]|uniref:Galectin n=1 Tax=Plakobranchus ocellatus TaxID=259542 RepID=A0AAV3Y553_9GAST|nr:hypothetical protein PoB_000382300 [Plakobranchus ocellatus]
MDLLLCPMWRLVHFHLLANLLFLVAHPWLVTGSCDLEPKTFIEYTAKIAGHSCSMTTRTLALCAMMCASDPECKVLSYALCNTDGVCTCILCDGLKEIDFDAPSVPFYMKVFRISEYSFAVRLPEGLVAYKPLVLDANLMESRVRLSLLTTAGDTAFELDINFSSRQVISNSRIGGVDGEAVVSRDPSNFDLEPSPKVNIMYVVKPAEFYVFLDNVLYSTFPLRVSSLSLITDFKLQGDDRKGFILWFAI